jgi:hypothetical protein
MADVKLQALDAEDLAVISAHSQDAVVRVAELAYRPRERRFAIVANRFDWTSAGTGKRATPHERRRAGLRFERVQKVQFSGFDRGSVDAVLVLLAIQFQPGEAPAGQIILQFAAGAAIRLDVDYIEAELKDLGAVWSTANMPDHGAADQGPVATARDAKPTKS